MAGYFLDTYGIIELYKGNPNYSKFKETKFYTSKLNLYELYYYFLKKEMQEKADELFLIFSQHCIFVSDDILKKAAKIRLEFVSKQKKDVSFIDAIGFTTAGENNLLFVTGDEAFKKTDGVGDEMHHVCRDR